MMAAVDVKNNKHTKIEIVLVSESRFYEIHNSVASLPNEDDETPFNLLGEQLRSQLDKSWPGEYEISHAHQGGFFHYGMIEESSCLCPEFALTILEIVAKSVDPEKWVFHCAIECLDLPYCTGFIITKGKMYIQDYEDSFKKWFN